jgi:hypothetical protein
MTSANDGNGRSEPAPPAGATLPKDGIVKVGTGRIGGVALVSTGVEGYADRRVTLAGGTGTPEAKLENSMLLLPTVPGSSVVPPLRCGLRTEVL